MELHEPKIKRPRKTIKLSDCDPAAPLTDTTLFLTQLPEFNDLHPDDVRVVIDNHYCLEKLTPCDPENVHGFECQACMEFDVKCTDVSGKPIVDLKSGRQLGDKTFPQGTGICMVNDLSRRPEDFNANTTNVLIGTIRTRRHILATTTTNCVNPFVVGKDPNIQDPTTYTRAPCDSVNACLPNGVLVHPYTRRPIVDVASDIDFELVPENLLCTCPSGYKSKLTVNGAPSCVADIPIPECSVRWGSATSYDCICNPALQVNLRGVADHPHTDSAYGSTNVSDAQILYSMIDRRDQCLPLPGVDGKNAAFSYNALSEKTEGVSPHGVVGGHLVGSTLLVKDGIKTVGTYGRSNYVKGGVVTVRGNGSVSAYLEGENRYRDETVVMEGGGEPPNHAFRVAPSPPFGVAGLGEESGEHTVGLLCSAGRIYPGGVYMRNGRRRRSTGKDGTKRFVNPRHHHDSFMRDVCDPGIVAGAFLVAKNFGGNNMEPPDHLLDRPLGLLNHRRASHSYDLVEYLEYILGKNREGKEKYVERFREVFNSRTIYEDLGQDLGSHFVGGGPLAEFDLLGGLLLQPIPISGDNAWMRNFVAEELWANATKYTDFYSGGRHVYGGIVDPKRFEVEEVPETVVLLGHRDGVLTNFNSHATGVSLQQFAETEREVRYMDEENIDFVKTQVHGTENYVKGASFLNLPPNAPPCFPELIQFTKRNLISRRRDLERFGNQYTSSSRYSREDFLAKRYAHELALKPVCTENFVGDGVVREYGTGRIHPTPAILEAYIQVNNQTNAGLVNDRPGDTRRASLVNFSQHCTNYFPFMATHYKFLLNGDAWMGASLNQYIPIFTLRDRTSFPRRATYDNHHYVPLEVSSSSFLSPFNDFRKTTNSCGCTNEFICNKYLEEDGHEKWDALFSRGTRHTVFLFQKVPPTSHIGMYNAYTALVSNVPLPPRPELLFNTPLTAHPLPQAPNRFVALPRNNKKMNYMYGRQIVTSFPTDYVPTTDGLPPVVDDDDSYRLFYPNWYDNPSRTRFMESLCTVAPSTARANMLNSAEDGAGNVVMQFGASAAAAAATTDNIPPVFFVHNYRVRLPSYAGYECGQVAAEAAHGFGGFLCPYRPWQEAEINNPLSYRGEMYDDQFFTSEEKRDVKAITSEFLKHYGSGTVLEISDSDVFNSATYPMCSRFSYGGYNFTRQLTDQTIQARLAMDVMNNRADGNDFNSLNLLEENEVEPKIT